MGKPLFKPNGQFNGSLPDPVKPPTVSDIPVPVKKDESTTPAVEYSFDFFVKNVPQNLVHLGQEILDYADEIEFVNHNHHHEEEYATLTDLINDPKKFNNNCGPVSWSVSEYLEGSAEGYAVSTITLQYNEGAHVAVLFTDSSGNEYVVDYTARQYWVKLPLPLISTRKTWERVIDNYVSILYRDTRKSE